MFDNAAILVGSYAAMSAGMSVAVAKMSPWMGPKLRHLFSGASPLAVLLAFRLEGGPSTVLTSMDLFAAGGLVALGVAVSSAVGKIVPTRVAPKSRLESR